MKLLRHIRAGLVVLIRIVAYEWIRAIGYLITQIREMVKRWLSWRKLPKRERKTSDENCVPIRHPAVRHPDPLIYSQTELLRHGLAVTWNNPDIQLLRAGVPVSSWELDPSTEYDVVARVWNKSPSAPVVGLPVIFSVLSFGIGTHRDVIGITSIDHLGVKGGPNHPAFATMRWTTPPIAGHYCIQVQLNPIDDLDFGNNLGAENTLVGHPSSPADFEFELRNDGRRDQAFRFEVDTYQIPDTIPCDEPIRAPPPEIHRENKGPVMPEEPARSVPWAHDRRNYQIPEGWSIQIAPATPTLAAGASILIRVQVTPPVGFTGRQAINVNGFNDLGPAGGVTLYVEAP